MIDSSRRQFLSRLAAASVAGACFTRALAAESAGGQRITDKMIERAEWISGLKLSDEQRKLLAGSLPETQQAIEALRAIDLDNGVSPALIFQPLGSPPAGVASIDQLSLPTFERPQDNDELAFLSVVELAGLIRAKQLSSVELTKHYLDRIARYDPQLHAIVTVTDKLALQQANAADSEIAAGNWRGPLHGIPYGAKDLLAYPGFPTTWGAGPYQNQFRSEKATVLEKLEQAGAVMVAKTTLGELAWGDEWFGGMTRNPWKLDQGSSGSSAGSASGVAAGLFAFAIGSETWGSIVSPSTRCGCSGLRPTFGRVSRHGAMALSWSMDKLGPIARGAEDLALILATIAGRDPLDPTARDAAFAWRSGLDVRGLRVAVLQSLFDFDYTQWAEPGEDKQLYREWQRFDQQTLELLREQNVQLDPVAWPVKLPVTALANILTVEAATAFDDLTRTGRDAQLKRQVAEAWPNVFRQGQFVSGVEYLRAQRVRRQLMEQFETLMSDYPVVVAPSFGGDLLLATNLTGHPQLTLPNGFRSDDTPTSITFTGRLWGEAVLVALGQHYQEFTSFHRRRPAHLLGAGGSALRVPPPTSANPV